MIAFSSDEKRCFSQVFSTGVYSSRNHPLIHQHANNLLWTCISFQSDCLWLFICTWGIPGINVLKNLPKWFMLADFILLTYFSFNQTFLTAFLVCVTGFLVSIHLKGYGPTLRISLCKPPKNFDIHSPPVNLLFEFWVLFIPWIYSTWMLSYL